MKMGSHEEDGVLAIVLFEEIDPKWDARDRVG
jgi:hypothetical protein